MSPHIRIGTQGWNYDAWVGPLYPSGTRRSDFLGVYARAFTTVEVDSTFYAIPTAKTVRGWAGRVGDDFTFALKLPQEITHEHRLRNTADLAERFFDCARELGPKLGPVLVQLGPDFGADQFPALAGFLPTLPRDIAIAVEFRDRRWLRERVLALLAEHNVALALSDGRWIPREAMLALAARPTANFAYIRWMGANRDLVDYSKIQIDRSAELEAWSQVIVRFGEQVITVYGYVNNHFAGHSPASVRDLQRLIGQRPVPPETLTEQITLL